MIRSRLFVVRSIVIAALICPLLASLAVAQQKQAGADVKNRIALGRLADGGTVTFVRNGSGQWGIEIAGGGAQRFTQEKPAQIEVYRGNENASQLASGYQSVQKNASAIVAKAKLAGEGSAAFSVEDKWTISGAVLSLDRKVSVTGAEDHAGFFSAIRLVTDSKITWPDADFLAPGLLYGQPRTATTAQGGSAYYKAKRFAIREDLMPAPLFGLSFRDGHWAAVMDMKPRGDTTAEETTALAATQIIDERLQFGALGAREVPEGGIEFGFWLPGTTNEFSGGFSFGGHPAAPITSVVRRRYNPVKAGFTQNYQVGFRFGENASLQGMERDTWRWAWETLKPNVIPIDVESARRALIDHLADRVLEVDGRAGIPFVIDSVSGKPGSFRPALRAGQLPAFLRDQPPSAEREAVIQFARGLGIDVDPKAAELELWPKAILGFCGENIEAAGQFLMEADRDPGPRGQRMRKLGLEIIDSFLRLVPSSPVLAGEGFDIRTGKPSAARGEQVFTLRATGEDMRNMVDIYRRERAAGRLHPEWIAWVKSYADWLLTQQREDGSFPESWQGGSGDVTDSSGGTTYAAVPLLVRMNKETGEKKYLDTAARAADYIWAAYGSKGVYIGATGGDVADKEAGMISTEAFLDLYDCTREPKWLERAQEAASYAETYIWLWNVPMIPELPDSELGWKHGVSTVGVTGIGTNVPGGADEYLDWAVPYYARLYKITGDEHDLDVARILLHNTKSMLALPGRTYDMLGPGWQQEHWHMGPGIRGLGAHRTWLPWISVNHLHGITALEEFDPVLYRQLADSK
jgi:hypothetical protein